MGEQSIDELGPVDYLVVEFPAGGVTSAGRWPPSSQRSWMRARCGCSIC